jgi:hypothetical protein
MNPNTKSSVTLPRDTVALIEKLQKRFNLKTKVDVVRRGLQLLDESSERILLREKYREAAYKVRETTRIEIEELDHLSTEGLNED